MNMASKMVEVQGVLLDKLLCDFCGQYLSSGPVLMDAQGQNMCGRCSTSSKLDLSLLLKNHVYDNLATLAYFPCKNYVLGCLEKLTTKNAIRHENTCPYNKHACPVYSENKCLWIGTLTEIESHYMEMHPHLIAKNPYKHKPNIRKNYEEFFLISDFNFTFMLLVRSDSSSGRFWHNVVLLGSQEIANLFEYTVKIGKDKSYNIKSKPVKAYLAKVCEKETIAHNISFLQTDLGDYDELNFELRISIKETYCVKCNQIILHGPILHFDNDSYYCDKCTHLDEQKLRKEEHCKFAAKGCEFKSSEKFLLKKHEIYLCETGYYCVICGKDVTERLIDHHTQKHCVQLQPNENNNISIFSFIVTGDKLNSYAVRAHETLFFFKLKPSKELITMELVSDTEEYGSAFFDCEYNISYPNISTKTLTGILNPMGADSLGTYDHPFDWSKYVFIPATYYRRCEAPDKINVDLTIVKHDDVTIY